MTIYSVVAYILSVGSYSCGVVFNYFSRFTYYIFTFFKRQRGTERERERERARERASESNRQTYIELVAAV